MQLPPKSRYDEWGSSDSALTFISGQMTAHYYPITWHNLLMNSQSKILHKKEERGVIDEGSCLAWKSVDSWNKDINYYFMNLQLANLE